MTWIERIAAARMRGDFDYEDQNLAERWVTCACGEQDPLIPRNERGCPLDNVLRALGLTFTENVARNEFDNAEVTLSRIEQRSIEILAELATQ